MVDWTKANVIPMSGLEAWHQYEPVFSTSGTCYDFSGKGRNMTAASNTPVLIGFGANAGWYFNGTRNPLKYTGSVPFQHLFVLTNYDDAAFAADYPGLWNSPTSHIILTGDAGTNHFIDNHSVLGVYVYRKNDVILPNAAMTAPMSAGPIAIIELALPAPITLDGIQVGEAPIVTARKWKGLFVESLAYSRMLTEFERQQVYQYFAMRYWIWQQTAAGLDVFPFPANKSRSQELDVERFIATPYNGNESVLERGVPKSAYSLPATNRRQEEFDAVKQFWTTHRRPVHFIYRDYRFYPARDTESMITSSLREQGSDVAYRFNYSFDAVETS